MDIYLMRVERKERKERKAKTRLRRTVREWKTVREWWGFTPAVMSRDTKAPRVFKAKTAREAVAKVAAAVPDTPYKLTRYAGICLLSEAVMTLADFAEDVKAP